MPYRTRYVVAQAGLELRGFCPTGDEGLSVMSRFSECGQVGGVDGVATALWFAVGLCTRAVKWPPLSWLDVVLA